MAGLSKVAQGIIKEVEELGEFAFKNDKQMEAFIARNPDAYEAAIKKHLSNNKPTGTGKKKRGSGANKNKKPPVRQEDEIVQQKAEETGELAAIAAGRDLPSYTRKLEAEAAARKAAGKGTPKRKVRGGGANKTKTPTKPKTAAASAKPKVRGAGATSRKPKEAPKTKAAPKPESKSLAVTGAAGKTAGRKVRGGGARRQQQVATRTGGAASKPASKVPSGGAARKKRRMTRAEAAAAGVAVGAAVGVANQKSKTNTTTTTTTKTPTTPKTPKTPKGRSGNIGRTNMGDFVTKAKVAPKPKKKYGESGMGYKAYQNLNFNRRK